MHRNSLVLSPACLSAHSAHQFQMQYLSRQLLFPPAPRDDSLHVSLQERWPGRLQQSAEVLS